MPKEYPISRVFAPELFADYETIIRNQRELTAELVHFNEVAKGFQGSGGLRDFVNTTKEAETSTKKLDAIIKELTSSGSKRAAIEKELNDAMKLEINSINNAVRQNKALKDARDMVNVSTKEGAKLTHDYNTKIDQNTKFIKENSDADKQRTSGIGKYFEGMIKGAVAMGAAYLSFNAIMNLGKSIIDSTHDSFESFEKSMDSAKAGFNVFLRTINTGDWGNFFTNIEKAIKRAGEYHEFLDFIGKKEKSQSIENIDTEKKIWELRTKALEKTIVNGKETIESINRREGALKSALVLEDAMAAKDISNLTRRRDELLKNKEIETGLGAATILKHVTEFADSETMMKSGEAYNNMLKDRKGLFEAQGAGADVATQISELNKKIKETPAAVEMAGTIIKKMGKASKDTFEEVAASIIAVKTREEELSKSTYSISRRDQTLIALDKKTRDDQIKKDIEDGKKFAKEREQIEKQLAEALNKTGLHALSDQMIEEKAIMKDSEVYAIANEQQKGELILGIEKKYHDLAVKGAEEYAKKQIEAEKKVIDFLEKHHARPEADKNVAEIQTGKDLGRSLTEQVQLMNAAEMDILLSQMGVLDQAAKEEIKAFIEKEKKKTDITKEEEKKRRELTVQEIKLGHTAATALIEILASDYDTDLKRYEKYTSDKKNKLDDQYSHGLLTKNAYDSAVKRLDADLAAKQKESAKKQADLAIATAVVNTFASLATSYAQALAGATAAGTATGPAAIIATPLFIIEALGAVIAGFEGVWQALDAAKSAGFEKGTHDAPEGWGKVHPGEGIERNGGITKTPERPALTFLKRHDKVFTRAEMQRMTASGLINTDYRSTTTEAKQNDMAGFLYLGQKIDNLPQTTFELRNGEIYKTTRIGQSKYEYHLNNSPGAR